MGMKTYFSLNVRCVLRILGIFGMFRYLAINQSITPLLLKNCTQIFWSNALSQKTTTASFLFFYLFFKTISD